MTIERLIEKALNENLKELDRQVIDVYKTKLFDQIETAISKVIKDLSTEITRNVKGKYSLDGKQISSVKIVSADNKIEQAAWSITKYIDIFIDNKKL